VTVGYGGTARGRHRGRREGLRPRSPIACSGDAGSAARQGARTRERASRCCSVLLLTLRDDGGAAALLACRPCSGRTRGSRSATRKCSTTVGACSPPPRALPFPSVPQALRSRGRAPRAAGLPVADVSGRLPAVGRGNLAPQLPGAACPRQRPRSRAQRRTWHGSATRLYATTTCPKCWRRCSSRTGSRCNKRTCSSAGTTCDRTASTPK